MWSHLVKVYTYIYIFMVFLNITKIFVYMKLGYTVILNMICIYYILYTRCKCVTAELLKCCFLF